MFDGIEILVKIFLMSNSKIVDKLLKLLDGALSSEVHLMLKALFRFILENVQGRLEGFETSSELRSGFVLIHFPGDEAQLSVHYQRHVELVQNHAWKEGEQRSAAEEIE